MRSPSPGNMVPAGSDASLWQPATLELTWVSLKTITAQSPWMCIFLTIMHSLDLQWTECVCERNVCVRIGVCTVNTIW